MSRLEEKWFNATRGANAAPNSLAQGQELSRHESHASGVTQTKVPSRVSSTKIPPPSSGPQTHGFGHRNYSLINESLD